MLGEYRSIKRSLSPARHKIPFRPHLSAATIGVVAVTWGPATSLVVGVVHPGNWQSLLLHSALPVAYYVVGRFTFAARSLWVATASLGLASTAMMNIVAPTPIWAIRPVSALLATAVFSVLVGLTYALLLVGPLWKCIKSGSHEDVDRAVAYAAPWVALPAAFDVAPHLVISLSTVLLLLPIASAFGALLRIRARRRWLADVRAGKHSRWRLLEPQAALTGVLPAILRSSGDAREGVLAFVHEADAPFRDSQQLEAVARVPLP